VTVPQGVIFDAIVVTARVHRLPINPDLFARCEHELERCGDDYESVISGLLNAFNWHKKASGA
jgi:hypothetical protein